MKIEQGSKETQRSAGQNGSVIPACQANTSLALCEIGQTATFCCQARLHKSYQGKLFHQYSCPWKSIALPDSLTCQGGSGLSQDTGAGSCSGGPPFPWPPACICLHLLYARLLTDQFPKHKKVLKQQANITGVFPKSNLNILICQTEQAGWPKGIWDILKYLELH